MPLAYNEKLRQAIEFKKVDECVKKMTDEGVDPEWIKMTLDEMGYNKTKTIPQE